jgi:transcriptional regulator with XRE-family HTH domain
VDKRWQGAALRKLRMLAGKSIADVAAACQVSQGSVSQWELGMTTPSRHHQETMAILYDMPIDLLLYEIGYELSNPPSLRQWYKARSGTIPASASGITTATDGGNAASEGAKRPLPRANATFARVPAFA